MEIEFNSVKAAKTLDERGLDFSRTDEIFQA